MPEDEKKKEEAGKKDEEKAPIDKITADASKAAEELIDDDSDIKPTEGFFFTSQRWH